MTAQNECLSYGYGQLIEEFRTSIAEVQALEDELVYFKEHNVVTVGKVIETNEQKAIIQTLPHPFYKNNQKDTIEDIEIVHIAPFQTALSFDNKGEKASFRANRIYITLQPPIYAQNDVPEFSIHIKDQQLDEILREGLNEVPSISDIDDLERLSAFIIRFHNDKLKHPPKYDECQRPLGEVLVSNEGVCRHIAGLSYLFWKLHN